MSTRHRRRTPVAGLTLRLGLSQQASADVGHLLTSSATATSNPVTGLSWAFFWRRLLPCAVATGSC
jgi:hypothetical protein